MLGEFILQQIRTKNGQTSLLFWGSMLVTLLFSSSLVLWWSFLSFSLDLDRYRYFLSLYKSSCFYRLNYLPFFKSRSSQYPWNLNSSYFLSLDLSFIIYIIIHGQVDQQQILMYKSLTCFTLLLVAAHSFHNPGIIVQIPTNYTLPIVTPPLPASIPSILLQKLELTSIQLRNIEYSWKYEADKFVIGLLYAVVSFDWKYGHDGGIGTFVEEYSDLVIMVTFDIDKDYRFKIDVDGAKITNEDKRHSIKISLGGKVPETVVVEVTNLILNHAKAAFRLAIKNAIVKIVQDFTEPLRKDMKIICKQSAEHKEHCIYLNTTLVGKPLVADNKQIIQINGAPYLDKGPSGFLDPKSVMFKVNSSEINVQLREELVTKIATLYNQISPIDITIVSTQISGVTDIDSQTLTVVFPKMKDYGDPRPVLLEVSIQSITSILEESPYLAFKASGKLKVQTEKQPKQIIPYLNNASGTVTVKIEPITKMAEAGIRINKVSVDNLEFEPSDITNNVINPPEIIKHLPTLMQWAAGGINGDLNAKIFHTEFVGLEIGVKIKALNGSVNTEIAFQHAKSTIQDNLVLVDL